MEVIDFNSMGYENHIGPVGVNTAVCSQAEGTYMRACESPENDLEGFRV